jgi:hypothetical protein
MVSIDEQRRRARIRYEVNRDAEALRTAEAIRMRRLRDQLDEIWEDEEDPRAEADRDALMDLDERAVSQ